MTNPLGPTLTRPRPCPDGEGWYVVVLTPAGSRFVSLPGDGCIEIGRDPNCFVTVADDSVSRAHARLSLGEWPRIEDLGSKNGSRLDGRVLSAGAPERLSPGALLEIGDVALVLQRGPLPAQRSTEDASREAPSPAMSKVLRAVRCVAGDDITVLLLGETGVGKEVTAESIHAASPRKGAPFVRVHCAAITDTLFESELFGHVKGAFTGATVARDGLLVAADGGTVFIDEVGELPPHVQVKLLRVLEDRRVRAVGGASEREVDVRFVAATNRDLEEEVAAGRFRSDLYFRLCGFTIRIPPLRQRQEEIPPLARSFVRELCEAKGRPVPALAPSLLEALAAYPFPGNVRELKNLMRRVLLVAEGDALRAEDLPEGELARRRRLMVPREEAAPPGDERSRILAALEKSGGNQTEAAKLLGMGRRTLIDRLDRYSIPRPRKGGS